MLATSNKELNSDDLAKSVGTNASYIRKVMALLKENNGFASQLGKSGIKLLVRPEDITLLNIYRIVEGEDIHIFQIY